MSETSLRRLYNRNFLDYASYVIKDRAIPDLADGFKPVQRRILWSLYQMDDGRFSKVANVIGHCMQFHPHGDRSIGDALVSLANRGFFIERQGNFGNILTGDEASAARYIECRLTDLARETLFNKRITDFEPSYDGRNREPVLLTAKLPVLLLLGAEGIAVGMSTKVLPHNFQEVLKAQISCLKGEDFELFPDFPQGGRIDISDYDNGRGKVRNRAKIEKDGNKNLIIRELPWGTTTESIINSIELASKKGKIKISSIDDYTTDLAEINIRLSRGVGMDEGLKRLYAHTDCEKSQSSNIVVIQDGIPVENTISEMIHYCSGRLIEILKLELKLEINDYTGRLHWLALEQIFIENRLYKNIEECTSWENVRGTVRDSLQPFLEESSLELTEEDIDKLLALKIRRISRFDIESHKKEIGSIKTSMKYARANLRNIVDYAVKYLETLIEKYGRNYPRLTSIEDFSDIDVKKVAIRNLKVGFNSDTGLLGTSIRGEKAFSVSEYDRFVFFLDNGTYRVIPVQDKYFIDGNILYCGVLDKDRVFTAVYQQSKTSVAYIKRFCVESFIMDKEYRYSPEEGRVVFFTEEPEMKLDFWFQRTKRMRRRKDECLLSDYRVTSESAKGVQLCGKKIISSIRGVPLGDEEEDDSYDETEISPEEEEKQESLDEVLKTEPPSPEDVVKQAEDFKVRSAETLKRVEKTIHPDDESDDLFENLKK
ncbi:MAG: DNA topoisomerase IV subunit A [Candidatus Aegiribacteria sp.]|nr:DNA topoisomerase IV subunit A [Candidatus Aegiribacteria sp.]